MNNKFLLDVIKVIAGINQDFTRFSIAQTVKLLNEDSKIHTSDAGECLEYLVQSGLIRYNGLTESRTVIYKKF